MTALARFGGGPNEGLCAAADSHGRRWVLQGGKAVTDMSV